MNNQTTSKTQHTPVPWKHQKTRGPQHAIDRKWEIVQPLPGGGEMVVVGEHTGVDCLTEANAEFITRACNSHYDLLELARQIVLESESLCNAEMPDDILAGARAAIAKATEDK